MQLSSSPIQSVLLHPNSMKSKDCCIFIMLSPFEGRMIGKLLDSLFQNFIFLKLFIANSI